MALTLRTVEAPSGWRWMRDAFALFHRRPFGFSALLMVFLVATMVVALVPLLGGVLQLVMWPMLSLGFMVASQSALLNGPVHPRQFIEPLRGVAARRKALLQLCVAFGLASVVVIVLCDALSEGKLRELVLLSTQADGDPQKLNMLMADRSLAGAALLGTALLGLLSVPFWHALALVHWSGQGAAQALFSSTVAVWRAKGAFVVYGLSWAALSMLFFIFTGVALALVGAAAMLPWLLIPATLIFTTVFYVSLLFIFNDSFGGTAPAPEEAAPGQPTQSD
jgi:hypothetical protein